MDISFESVLPANGWEVIFDDEKYTRIPLVGWGFNSGRNGADGRLVGLIPGSHLQLLECEDVEQFLCYIPHGAPFP
jgi:hypothetical protein